MEVDFGQGDGDPLSVLILPRTGAVRAASSLQRLNRGERMKIGRHRPRPRRRTQHRNHRHRRSPRRRNPGEGRRDRRLPHRHRRARRHVADAAAGRARPRRRGRRREGRRRRHQGQARRPRRHDVQFLRRLPELPGARVTYCHEFFPRNFFAARADGSQRAVQATASAINGNFFGQSSFATHAICHEVNVVKVPPMCRSNCWGRSPAASRPAPAR